MFAKNHRILYHRLQATEDYEVYEREEDFMKKSQYIITYDSIDGKHYLMHSESGNIVAVDHNKQQHLYDILDNPDSYSNNECYRKLCDLGFLIEDNKDEFQVTIGKNILRSYCEKNYLELTIMPTEQCNFRCVYCYEDFKKPKMADNIKKAIITFVRREIHNRKGLIVNWFGGEPLLAMDIIEDLSENFIDICNQNHKVYSASMTTNGYLLDLALFEKLRKLHVNHFQITIDGDKNTHDSQRVLVGGGHTYEKIMDNIKNICNNAKGKLWTISIRTNVTNQIIADIVQFKKNVIDPFRNDSRIYIMLRKMWTNFTSKADSLLCEDQEFEAFVEKCELSEKSLYQEYIFAHDMNFCCYASNPNSYVFGSDGMIYKCTYALYDNANQVGQISDGGITQFNQEKLSYWIAPRTSNSPECRSCASFATCVSKGCPYKQKMVCNSQTLEVLKYYIPQFFKLAKYSLNLTEYL